MTITVNTPDGGTANFPDGTDPGAITSALKAKFGGPDSKPSYDDTSVAGLVGDTAYRAANTGTLGLLDYGLAGLHKAERATGWDPNATDIDQIRQENADWQSNHPLLALGADVAGYGAGFGKFGLAAKAAEGAASLGAGKALAAGLGGATEGAAAGGLSSTFAGDSPGDALKNAALGAAGGGALGGLVGARTSKFGAAPADVPASVLQANKDALYKGLENTPVKMPDVSSAVSSGLNKLTPGQQADLSSTFKERIANVRDAMNSNQPLSLSDTENFARTIGGGMRTNSDKIAGAKIGEALADLGGPQVAAARDAQARLSDVSWLDSGNATPAGAQTRVDNPRYNFTDDTRKAMQNLADAGPSPWTKAAQNAAAFGVNHGIGYFGGGAIGGALGHAGIGELMGLSKGGSLNLGQIPFNAMNKAAINRALKAARATSATGRYVDPSQYYGKTLPAVASGAQRVLFSQEAAQ